MNQITCDICGEKATKTFEVYTHRAGFRNLFGLHATTLRIQGRMIDLCDEHARPITALCVLGTSKAEVET